LTVKAALKEDYSGMKSNHTSYVRAYAAHHLSLLTFYGSDSDPLYLKRWKSKLSVTDSSASLSGFLSKVNSCAPAINPGSGCPQHLLFFAHAVT
jgi:hypothetical protein